MMYRPVGPVPPTTRTFSFIRFLSACEFLGAGRSPQVPVAQLLQFGHPTAGVSPGVEDCEAVKRKCPLDTVPTRDAVAVAVDGRLPRSRHDEVQEDPSSVRPCGVREGRRTPWDGITLFRQDEIDRRALRLEFFDRRRNADGRRADLS